MYETRKLDSLILQLFEQIKSHVSISDFCSTAATVEFTAYDGLLENDLILFKLNYPGFELEAKCRDGIVFIRRNGLYQHSEQIRGRERLHVAIQWTVESIGCGITPWSSDPSKMNEHIRSVHTPYTVPPLELHRTLRANNLLMDTVYKSADDLFATLLDCIHFCEEDIRKFGAERFAWRKNGQADHPLDEPEISRFVASFLAAHGASRNFDVYCEPLAGSGNVDFNIVAPVLNSGLTRVAIEAKKADSSQLAHGFSQQLPAYMQRLPAQYGVYLVYWLKSPNYVLPHHGTYAELEIDVLHPLPRPPGVRSVGLRSFKAKSTECQMRPNIIATADV